MVRREQRVEAAPGRTPAGAATVESARFWPEILDGVDEAVLALDASGVLRAANAVATRTFPRLRVGEVVVAPEPLAAALRAGHAGFDIDHEEHRLRGRRLPVGPLTVWYLRDVTEQAMGTDALVGAALVAAALYGEQARTADVLRASLLPAALPAVPGALLGAAYRSARERLRIGGDFYDVYPTRDGTGGGWHFVLGDVCGKGVEAAVQTGRVRQALHALTLVEHRPASLLRLLNEAILAGGDARFSTMVAGRLESRPDGTLDLHLASGGHPAPLVLRADGSVRAVAMTGTVVGAFPAASFGDALVTLAPGDTLIVHSDGVTEARGGPDGSAAFGRRRLVAGLAGYAATPPATIAERIEQLVVGWLTGGRHDDIAALVIQAEPARGTRRHLHPVADR